MRPFHLIWRHWRSARSHLIAVCFIQICTFIGVSCLCIVLSYFGDKGDYQEVLR